MKQIIKVFLAEILTEMGVADAGIAVEIPENPEHGDYTTNVAMLLAGRLKGSPPAGGQAPLKIAQQIVDAIKKHQKESDDSSLRWLAKAESAPPGFVNLWLSETYFGSQIAEVIEQKDHYGTRLQEVESQKSKVKSGEKTTAKKKTDVKPKTKLGKLVQSDQLDQFSGSSAGKGGKKSDSASFGNPSTSLRPRSGRALSIMVEFAHPNTHKAFHIGHLRNIATGESIIRLLESQGNRVIRVNYQGDVGMHIAKCLYGMLQGKSEKFKVKSWEDAKQLSLVDRVEYLGEMYAAGSTAFEKDEKAKGIIVDLNALIYASAQRYAKEVGRDPGTTDYLALVKNHVHPVERVYELWKETRQWSLDYFDTIYKRVHSHYDRFYFESECLEGVDLAREGVKRGVLKESDGAIIFDGKAHGIDTRVFVNSLGLPTYEAKELALSRMETTEFGQLDRIIHVVGPEQASFFTVTFKAEELLGYIKPGLQQHLIYGWVKLKQGKMSSRSGNVVLGEWLLDAAAKSIYEIMDRSTSPLKESPLKVGDREEIAEKASIAAVKYAFLKVGTRQEIAFDLKESISFDGDSGPYLLYTYARCKSVLRKSQNKFDQLVKLDQFGFNPEERNLARRIAQFPDVVAEAARNFAPNTLCTYLFHLAQEFNLLYAKHPILGQSQRLVLTAATAQVIKNGLYFLGIETVERM